MDRKYTADMSGREPLCHGANELDYFSNVGGKGSPSQTFNRVQGVGVVGLLTFDRVRPALADIGSLCILMMYISIPE